VAYCISPKQKINKGSMLPQGVLCFLQSAAQAAMAAILSQQNNKMLGIG
jgi:hypothetical protein